ncbi:L-threonylcarbamoyladenylate synthase [Sphingomicrobium astaxanthinifaciens]|uniref:L-threonylcarbamoyladenylate synthase n=1 Tax=Sphingomicrobium astaxanthinifaciens TaxID=1227949 RepID=UPI001FCA9276|nr:L-threonylcarbamoyladenylate synthase [Sphingomicrobium astaxanthinifaciens]MCJ7420344.1 threonylcarbamoyl-AMP synthase [Sphingomicrobium astaxanthinifaciens]
MAAPSLPTEIIPANAAGIDRACTILAQGAPVAVPTETVYGLAADATDALAVARIYKAKGRPDFNPLITHVFDLEAAEALGVFNDEARALAERYWPGPLTLVLPRREATGIADVVTAGLPTIAIRVPAHPVMRALLHRFGKPLAAPSANASGRISPTQAAHVAASLAGRIRLILDGGPCEQGIESTIVAATGEGLRLLRRGPIHVPAAVEAGGERIEAPGQLLSHYAPNKPLRLDAREAEAGELLIGYGEVEGDLYLGAEPVTAAARLFSLLHQADASAAERIAVAPVAGDGLAAAIRDRLRRAAAPRP